MTDIGIAEPVSGANRRPAFPFEAGRPFGSAACAPPSLSAAVAHFGRSTKSRAPRAVGLGTEANEGNKERDLFFVSFVAFCGFPELATYPRSGHGQAGFERGWAFGARAGGCGESNQRVDRTAAPRLAFGA
jgi:hypothetical protein